jgi:hypothetical protein
VGDGELHIGYQEAHGPPQQPDILHNHHQLVHTSGSYYIPSLEWIGSRKRLVLQTCSTANI